MKGNRISHVIAVDRYLKRRRPAVVICVIVVRAFLSFFLPESCRPEELHHLRNATIECSFVERRVCGVLRVLPNTLGCALVLRLVRECTRYFLFILEV